MTTVQEMTKEAICSALYSMPFTRFLGEVEDVGTGKDVAWFRLYVDPTVDKVNVRTDPRVLVVGVQEDLLDIVTVTVQWLNLSAGFDNPMRGQEYLRIPTGRLNEVALHSATEQVVTLILDMYKQVLAQTGIAGPIEELAPESAYEETDADMAEEEGWR